MSTNTKTADRVRLGDAVEVKIYGPDGSLVTTYTSTNLHSVEDAVQQAVAWENLETRKVDPGVCTFDVENLTAGTSARYRINAHGNLTLIL